MARKLSVLLVEDSEDDALLVLRQLEKDGFLPDWERVDTALAMEEALKRRKWDVVLCDFKMPSFDAFGALEVLKSSGLDIPFIIVSGSIGEDIAVKAMRAGAHDYLMKGNLARLAVAIDRELREAETRAERMRAEEALIERDRRFQAMVEKGSDVIVLVDNGGTIKYASPTFKTSLGRDASDVEGRPAFEFIEKFVHPDDGESTMNALSALLDLPGGEGRAECRFKHGDGTWHHIVAVGKNHLQDPALNGIVLNIRDITEQKRAGDALRESERKYRQLFEEMTAGYALQEMVINEKGEPVDYVTLEVNPEYERLLGVKREQVLGKRATKAEPKLDRAWIQMFGRVALTGQPCRYTQYASNIDKYFEGSAYSPRKGQVAVTFMDVTERIKGEEMVKASLKEKEALLQEIHHRVKNNLQVISSLLNTQTRHIKDPEAIKAFKESQSRIRSMALIHDRLYHARDLARIDFTEYADRLVAGLMMAHKVNPENVVVELEVQRVFLGIDAAVPCGLLLNELVSNAFKHAFPEGRRGEVRVILEKMPEGALRLSVSDNGVGLPEGVDPTTAETMGLQIVSALADQLDAKMEVSREGGTRFTLTFTPDERGPLVKKSAAGEKFI